jgi:putative aldouronate transport system substrate-binding protein
MRRVLVILLALALCAGVLGGCSSPQAGVGSDTPAPGGDESGTDTASTAPPAAKDPETIVLYLITFNNIPDDYSQVSRAINEHIAKTYPDANVELDLRLFGPADYNNKIQLAIQSGVQMDLFIPLDLQTAISQGMCADIAPYLDTNAQGLLARLDSDFVKNPFAPLTRGESIYGVPINKAVVITPTLSYNKEMLAGTGYSIDDINSVWDLTKVYEKAKELYPDAYCFAGTNAQDSYVSLIAVGENQMDRLGDAFVFTAVTFGDSGKVVNYYDTPEFRKYTDLMREWYLAGYMPQDMATSTTTATEYAMAGRLFSSWASYSGVVSESENSVFNALTGTDAFGSKWIAPAYVDTMTSSMSMCVSSTSKSPEAAVKMLDILYKDEFVVNTILYGVEGESYVKVSDHVIAFPEGLDANTVPYTAYLCNGVIGSEALMWTLTTEEDFQSKLEALKMNQTVTTSPFYGFVFDPADVLNEMTAISNVISQYYPGLSCGSLDPDVALPEFLTALEAAGMSKVVEAKQTQLDAWIAANT